MRFKAHLPEQCLPTALRDVLPAHRLEEISGVQAPIFFKVPLIVLTMTTIVLTMTVIVLTTTTNTPIFFKVPLMRHLLFLCGAGTPATKKGMMALFERRSDFGILPGGSEEVRRRCVCVCVCVCVCARTCAPSSQSMFVGMHVIEYPI